METSSEWTTSYSINFGAFCESIKLFLSVILPSPCTECFDLKQGYYTSYYEEEQVFNIHAKSGRK